jgi:hypothetical protein
VPCELYAKLLAMVVQQWALRTAGYQMLRHSARRAARRVRAVARQLLAGLEQVPVLVRAVLRLARALQRRCRIVRRRGEPSTLDRLTELDPTFEASGEAAADEPRQAA